MRVVTVGGRGGELIGEKRTGRQVDGRETPYSNRLTLKQKRKGGRKGHQARPVRQLFLHSRGLLKKERWRNRWWVSVLLGEVAEPQGWRTGLRMLRQERGGSCTHPGRSP